jgi:hypothetical protein
MKMFRVPDVPWLSGLILVIGIIAFIIGLVQFIFGKNKKEKGCDDEE